MIKRKRRKAGNGTEKHRYGASQKDFIMYYQLPLAGEEVRWGGGERERERSKEEERITLVQNNVLKIKTDTEREEERESGSRVEASGDKSNLLSPIPSAYVLSL